MLNQDQNIDFHFPASFFHIADRLLLDINRSIVKHNLLTVHWGSKFNSKSERMTEVIRTSKRILTTYGFLSIFFFSNYILMHPYYERDVRMMSPFPKKCFDSRHFFHCYCRLFDFFPTSSSSSFYFFVCVLRNFFLFFSLHIFQLLERVILMQLFHCKRQ